MSNTNDGGPAFPVPGLSGLPNGDFFHPECGMTLRQYAAIKLRVPDSGDEWLDKMIEASLRDYFAAQVVGSAYDSSLKPAYSFDDQAKYAYMLADAMLRARDGGAA